MDECVYPSERVYHIQMAKAGDPNHFPAVLGELEA